MKLHITEKALGECSVPEGKKYVLIFDSEQKGFAVQKTRNGSMSYVIISRDAANKQRQEKLAKVGQISVQAARALVAARLTALGADKVTGTGRGRAVAPLMDDYFYKVFFPIVRTQSRSYQTHASLYRNHIQPVFGALRMDEVSGEQVVAFHTTLGNKTVAGGLWKTQLNKKLAAGTVKRILILLRHIFNVAIKNEDAVVTKNPTGVLTLTSERKIVGKFLSMKQLGTLMKEAEGSINKSLADILRVMGGTGLRRDNVLAMEWAWYDEERGTLLVPEPSDKAKKGFSLHLSDGVQEVLRLRRAMSQGPWVFPNPRTGKPYTSCRAAWVTARDNANLPTLRMHDLRHTYASMMLDSGSDIIDVQGALGHTQIKTTAVYLHLTAARKREHANAAARATGLFA